MTQPPNASDMPGSLAAPSPGEDFGKFQTIAQITAAVSSLTADGNGNTYSDPANAGYPIADAWANASKLFQDAMDRLRTIQDEFVAALKTARDELQGAAGDEFQYLAGRVLERSRIVSDSLNGYPSTVDAIGAAIRNFNSAYWRTVANILDQNVADQQKVQAVVAQATAVGLHVDGQALATAVEQRDEREVFVPELRGLLVNLATQYQNYGSNLVPLHAMPTPKSGTAGAPSKDATTTLNPGHQHAFPPHALLGPGPQVRTKPSTAPSTRHHTAPVTHAGSVPRTNHKNPVAARDAAHNPGGTPHGNLPGDKHPGETGATAPHHPTNGAPRTADATTRHKPGTTTQHDSQTPGQHTGQTPGHEHGGTGRDDGQLPGRHATPVGHEHGSTTTHEGRPATPQTGHKDQHPTTTSHGPNGTTATVPTTPAAGLGAHTKETAAQKQRQQTLEQTRKAADDAIQRLEHQPGLGHSPTGKVREQALHDAQQAVDHAIQKMEHATNPGHMAPTGKHGETTPFVAAPGGNSSGKDRSSRNRWGVTTPFTSHKDSPTGHPLGKSDSGAAAAAREKALHDAQRATDDAIKNLESPGGLGPTSGSKVKSVTLSGKQPTDRSTTPVTGSNGSGKDRTGRDRSGVDTPLRDVRHGRDNPSKTPATSTYGPKSTSHVGSTGSGQQEQDAAREKALEQARQVADDAVHGLENGGGLGSAPVSRIKPVSLATPPTSPTSPSTTGSVPTDPGSSLTPTDPDPGPSTPTVDPSLQKDQQDALNALEGLNDPTGTGPTDDGSRSPVGLADTGSGTSGGGHHPAGVGHHPAGVGHHKTSSATNDAAQKQRALHAAQLAADKAVQQLENGGGLGNNPSATLPSTTPGHITPASLPRLSNPPGLNNPTGTALHDAQNAIDKAIRALPGFNAHDTTGNTLHAAEKAINDAIGSLPGYGGGSGGAHGHSSRSSLDGVPGGTSLLNSDVASQSGFTKPDSSASPTTAPTTSAGAGGITRNSADGGGGMPMMPMGGMAGGPGGSEQSREPSVWLQADEKHWRDDENVAPPVIGRS